MVVAVLVGALPPYVVRLCLARGAHVMYTVDTGRAGLYARLCCSMKGLVVVWALCGVCVCDWGGDCLCNFEMRSPAIALAWKCGPR